MTTSRFTILLCLVALGAFGLRTVPLASRVITSDAIRLQEVDGYYHVRLEENLVNNFPHRLSYDPYRLFPNGQGVDVPPMQDYVVAVLALLFGLGAPSIRTIHLVAAFLPPILGSLTCVPTGWTGRKIAGPWTGIAAALTVALLPGGNLTQSVIGYADHHALEIFLLAWSWWFLVQGIDAIERDDRAIAPWALLGACVSAYALTWIGGPGLPGTIALVVTAATLAGASDPRRLRALALATLWTSVPAFLAVFFVGYRWGTPGVVLALLVLLPLVPITMLLLARIPLLSTVRRRRWGWIAVTGVLIAVLYPLLPGTLRTPLEVNLHRFFPNAQALSVGELRPLIGGPSGSIGLVWEFFQGTVLFAPIGFFLLVLARRRRSGTRLLVPILVGIVFIPAALLQLRFAAGASLPLALLSAALIGLATGEITVDVGLHRFDWLRHWRIAVVAAWLILIPALSVPEAYSAASTYRGPEFDWPTALAWLRSNTPDPFSDSTAYFLPSDRSTTVQASYGVLTWWDYGYYITMLARRVPTSNPSQSGAVSSAKLLLEEDADSSAARLVRQNLRYIALDARIPAIDVPGRPMEGKFPALATWAGQPASRYFETVAVAGPNGSYEPRTLYYAEYFRTLAIRLSLYGNERYEPAPNTVWVVRTSRNGALQDNIPSNLVLSRPFASFSIAEQYLHDTGDTLSRIASYSSFESCVPLAPIRGVAEAFRGSRNVFRIPSTGALVPQVRIFSVDTVRSEAR